MKRPMVLHFYRATGARIGNDGPPPKYLWRWRIRASNGRIIADSAEAYGRLRDAQSGARLVTGARFPAKGPGSTAGIWRIDDHREWRIVVDK